jgi:HK97 family phage portal protein
VGLFTNWLSRLAPSRSDWKPPSSWPITWWQQGYQFPRNEGNAAVEACVGAISQTIAMLPIAHWKENDKGGSERVKLSAVNRVLRRPNNYQTKADFFLNLVRSELLRGNGYALAQRNGRTEITALHIVNPSSLYPFVSETDGSIFYQFADVPVGQDFEPVIQDLYRAEDVLHVRMHTPMHPLVGETPLLAAALAVDAGNAIAAATSAFHKNMSRPSGYLKVPGALKPDIVEALRGEWGAAYQGVSSGRVAVLQGGVEWEAMSMTAVDAAVIDSYKLSIADIARVYRVPLAIIGDNTSTYNNTEVLMKFWLATGLGFMLEHIELALDVIFQLPEGEWIEFDTDYMQRADFAARIEGLVRGVQGGLFAPNEARAREGLPRVPFGDEPRVQSQVVPLSFASVNPGTAAPSAPAAKVNPLDPGGTKPIPGEKPKDEEDDDEEEENSAEVFLTAEQITARYEELSL